MPCNNPIAPAQFMQMLLNAGFRGDGAVLAYSIAVAESGLCADAIGQTSAQAAIGQFDRGIFQFNNQQPPVPISDACAYDPQCAANSAFAATQGGTGQAWSHWSTFLNGAYNQFLGEAGNVYNALSSIPGGLPNPASGYSGSGGAGAGAGPPAGQAAGGGGQNCLPGTGPGGPSLGPVSIPCVPNPAGAIAGAAGTGLGNVAGGLAGIQGLIDGLVVKAFKGAGGALFGWLTSKSIAPFAQRVGLVVLGGGLLVAGSVLVFGAGNTVALVAGGPEGVAAEQGVKRATGSGRRTTRRASGSGRRRAA